MSAPDKSGRPTPVVDVVIPVYNEEKILPQSIGTLVAFLREHVHVPWRVLITDNASIDRTEEVSRELCAKYPEVDYVRIPRKGRGGALRQVWLESPAQYLTYMDVDLSTNLHAFPDMLQKLEGGDHIVIGSRLRHDANTTRSFKREVISRTYNLIVKAFFRTNFTDAQCGFKGIRRETADLLLPFVEDIKWFFDTELLVMAEKSGHRIGEVPVEWIEDLDTRVKLVRTIYDDMMGIFRMVGGLSATLRRIDEARPRGA